MSQDNNNETNYEIRAAHITNFRPLTYGTITNNYLKKSQEKQYNIYFNLYFIGALLINLFCLFMKNHGSDMGFWYNWTTHLTERGYKDFSGNYPPVYIHWLYVSGNFLQYIGLPIDSGQLLKFANQLPIITSHLILTGLTFSLLRRFNASAAYFHTIMLLIAFNPALLFDGPIWGQVDIFPTIFVMLAFYLIAIDRFCFLALPLYTLALLTKFQMICFAPVFAILFFRNAKDTVIGCILSLITIALILLPLAMSESLWKIIHRAYIQTLGEYPYTTLNAGNIWMILTDNTWPDSHVMFGIDENSSAASVFTAKRIGIMMFFAVTLSVFLTGLYHLWKGNHRTPQKMAEQLIFYALVCSTGFFVLLPGMHERYVIPAVITALLYAAIRPQRMIYAAVLTFVGLLNMTQVHPITNSSIWLGISWIIVILFAFLLWEMLPKTKRLSIFSPWVKNLIAYRHLPLISYGVSMLFMLGVFQYIYTAEPVHLKPNQIFLTDLTPIRATQDYGRLQVNRNVSNTILSAGNVKYAHGLGTHANSTIVYELPKESSHLDFIAGVDDIASQADLSFAIYGDGRLLWQSEAVYSKKNNPVFGSISIKGVKVLTLRVYSRGEIGHDHANWINPIITLDTESVERQQ